MEKLPQKIMQKFTQLIAKHILIINYKLNLLAKLEKVSGFLCKNSRKFLVLKISKNSYPL